MHLRVPSPPKQGSDILKQILASLQEDRSSFVSQLAADTGNRNLDIALPHRVFFIGLNDVAEGRLLDAAIPKAWRYLILNGGRPVAAAEISIDTDTKEVRFKNINSGPFVSGTIEGLQVASELSNKQTYELRLLEIPGLYVVALWLHGRGDIIPLKPAPTGLEANKAMSENDFFRAIQPRAKECLYLDDRPIVQSKG